MRSLLLAATAVSVLGLSVAGRAHAGPVQYSVTDPNPFRYGDVSMNLHLGSNYDQRVQAGQITIAAKDVATNIVSTLQVYCTDIFDMIMTPSLYNRGTLAATVDDTPTINAIGALIQNGNPLVSDATSSAALQLAIWDVLYEGYTGHNDVTTGNFYASNTDASVLTAANADIARVNNGTWTLGGNASVYELLPAGGAPSQYLSYVAVPEPATLALLGFGMLGLVFARRRRSTSSPAA